MTLSFRIMEEILNTLDEEFISERNKENKQKKNEHENNINGITQEHKDKVQKKINDLKKSANDNHWISVALAGASQDDIDAAKPFADKSDREEKQAKILQNKLSSKFKNREHINCALDLMEEIMNVLEKGVSVNKWADAAQKRIDDNPHMGITSRGKEELERLKEIAKLPRDGKAANTVKAEAAAEEATAASKAAEAMLKGNKEEQNKQEGIAWKKGLVATDNKGYCFDKWKANSPKKQSINCALDLMEEIISYADNIFELDIENKQNISPNKISRIKKDKDGKDVEVVSVADELFPHEGTAKQQFDKKILDKINDMIEGTGSLEDLIQFVRKGVQTKKMVHENKNFCGKETGQGSLEDDISTTLTGNMVHQNIENGIKKVISPNKKAEEK